MDRRGDERIEMQLPCRLSFPDIWPGSLVGFTGNLHRNGVLVACRLKPESELPSVGDAATVHIELPTSQNFPPKCVRCDTTLIRIEELGNRGFQFAMRIVKVDFQDVSPLEFESGISSYIM